MGTKKSQVLPEPGNTRQPSGDWAWPWRPRRGQRARLRPLPLLQRRPALRGCGYRSRSRLEHGPAVAMEGNSDAEGTLPGPIEVLTRRATPGRPASWPHSFDHCFEVGGDKNRHFLRSAGTPGSTHVGVFLSGGDPSPRTDLFTKCSARAGARGARREGPLR
jgi:hypothetical protein